MDPQAKTAELEDQCRYILKAARAAGADEAFVSASYGLSARIQYEKNDFNLAAYHEGGGFGITVHKDQRQGAASVNTFSKEAVDEVVRQALAFARFSIPDEYLGMAEKSDYIALPETFDPGMAELPMGELRRLAEAMIAAAKHDARVSLDGASVERSAGVHVIANTRGVLASDHSTSLNWYLMGMAIEGADVTSFDHLSDFAYFLPGVESKVLETAGNLAQRLLACLGAKPARSFKGAVLLPACAVDELLLDPIVYHIVGRNIMDGKSRFSNSLGETIASPSVTFSDDPHDIALRGCTAWSGEGVPTRGMALVERGVLKTHLDSVYSARRRGTKPTGNGGGPHGPLLAQGTRSLAELRRAASPLLEFTRYSGSVDPITGDFSGLAKGGRLYVNGADQGPVKETMIAGNTFELLRRDLIMSDERFDDSGSYRLPCVLVDGVSVTSAAS